MAKRNLWLGGSVPMEPGERDRRVVIQQMTASVGGSGFPVETWATLDTVSMRKLDAKAEETFRAGQLSGAGWCQWEMGYRADMDPELVDVVKTRRLSYQDRVYDITGASQIGRRDGIELITLAKVG